MAPLPRLPTAPVPVSRAPAPASTAAASAASSMGQQMTPDTAKVRCKTFLSTLLRLSCDQVTESVMRNVRALIQGLIDGRVEPEVFTTKLEKELNSSPQPCLVPFLKKSLPYLQHALATRELSIEGVLPPTINHVGKLPASVSVPPCGLLQLEMAPFNWPMRLKQIDDDTHHLHIPPDITFKILEDDVKHKIDAHKMVLGMVSPVFHRMLFVLEGGDKEIFVEGTTPAAFKIMKNAIYNVVSMEKSLEGKSATEVFAVLDLVKRYQIRELKKIVLDHLASFSLADDTVLEVAAAALKRSQSSEFGGQGLFLHCAKFLRPKFKDAQAVFQYLADHKEQKEIIHELLVVMKDLDPPTDSVEGMDASNASVNGFVEVSESSKQCVTPDKFRGKSVEEIEAMGDNDKLEYTLHMSMKSVPATTNNNNLSSFKVQGVDRRDASKQCVTPVKFRGKTAEEIEEMGDKDRLEYTLHMSMKSVPVTANMEEENLTAAIKASLNNTPAKVTNDTVKRKKARQDLKDEEDCDKQMRSSFNKPPAKKAKSTLSKSSTSTS